MRAATESDDTPMYLVITGLVLRPLTSDLYPVVAAVPAALHCAPVIIVIAPASALLFLSAIRNPKSATRRAGTPLGRPHRSRGDATERSGERESIRNSPHALP